MSIIISAKYHGPTNHRGSRWIATMADSSNGKVRLTLGYDYGNRNGTDAALTYRDEGWQAAYDVVQKWDRSCNFSARVRPGRWHVEPIGQDHRGEHIFKATFKYQGES